ncbi:MAG: aldo/keto reductase [Oscillospiraceae bacterium]|jgi:predicted aldo/keto reductase-like oxidoreductase|nr:aldo/keto reductase [Oscillospiraceae bacterium]
MKYRIDKSSNNELSVLGLGCMRFPRSKAETERMILTAIDNGINYFDTAYIYPNSEQTLGTILAKHNKRKDIYIATKLPLLMCKKTEDFDKFFDIQLRHLQTDYIDYYMLHNISDISQWEAMLELGIEKWISEKKESGKIHRIGFSFHGSYDEFIKILNAYPWEYCMIQYNYYDINYQAGKKGLQAAAEKEIPVIIMEPLLGGRLADGLPRQAVEIFAKADPDRAPVDWALRWLWNQSEVTVILSGMSTVRQIENNVDSANNYIPLSDDELTIYDDVIKQFRKSYKIPCTGCDYCMPCPKGIDISSCFSAYNTSYAQRYMTGIMLYANSTAIITKYSKSPRNCTKCGKCEKHCPQNIAIIDSLKKVTKRLEPLPLRLIISLVRRVMS